jgi:nicotinamidase-related amidase
MSLIHRLRLNSTAFFVCDIQEKFRDVIWAFPSVIGTAQKMLQASKVLEVPVVVTEQYPKGLGHTATELNVEHAVMNVAKTKFSMLVPQVSDYLKAQSMQSIVLFGIEAQYCVVCDVK